MTTSIALAGVIENVTYSDGAVWAAEGDVGTIVRIDPTTNEKRVYRLGHHLEGVAADKGVVAVGVQQSAQDVTAGLKGRIVHLALKDDYLDWSSPDPAAVANGVQPVPGPVPLRDLREALQLPRCPRGRGEATRARSCCRLAPRL